MDHKTINLLTPRQYLEFGRDIAPRHNKIFYYEPTTNKFLMRNDCAIWCNEVGIEYYFYQSVTQGLKLVFKRAEDWILFCVEFSPQVPQVSPVCYQLKKI